MEYKGISFPFRFGSGGGVRTSKLSIDDYDRIYQSIYQIIFTYTKERVNASHIGCGVKRYLFEPFTEINTLAMIKFEIEKAIAEQEERVEVLDVTVTPKDEGKIIVNIYVLVVQFNVETTLTYELESEVENL